MGDGGQVTPGLSFVLRGHSAGEPSQGLPNECSGEQREEGLCHVGPKSLLEGVAQRPGENLVCPRLPRPMTHRQASELWQDVGARPGSGWAPQGGHLQPSTKNMKPNQPGFSSDARTYFIGQHPISPTHPGLCTRPDRTPRPVTPNTTTTATCVSSPGGRLRWPLESPAQAQCPDSCVTVCKVLILSGPRCSHLSNGIITPTSQSHQKEQVQ